MGKSKSQSSHRGKKIRGDFDRKDGTSILDTEVRAYVDSQYVEGIIRAMGKPEIKNVAKNFNLDQEEYKSRIKGITKGIIEKHKHKTSDEEKQVLEAAALADADAKGSSDDGEDDESPTNSLVRTECLRLLYAGMGDSIRDAHHEVPSETAAAADANDDGADGGRDWHNRKRTEGSSDNENDSPPQAKKAKAKNVTTMMIEQI